MRVKSLLKKMDPDAWVKMHNHHCDGFELYAAAGDLMKILHPDVLHGKVWRVQTDTKELPGYGSVAYTHIFWEVDFE